MSTLLTYEFSSDLRMRLNSRFSFILSLLICLKLCSGLALAKLGQVLSFALLDF